MLEFYLFFPIIALLLIIIFKKLVAKNNANQQNLIYLFGESGSGKTTLIYQMAINKNQETLSSIQTNQAVIPIKISENKTRLVNIIDIPGHAYIEQQFYKDLNQCQGIIILIDSTQKSFDKCSNFLYTILIQKSYQKKKQPIILALNKQDLSTANKSAYFEQQLNSEMEIIKLSKKALNEQDQDINDNIKYNDKKFTLEDFNVKICELSALKKEISQLLQIVKKITR